MDPTVNQSKGLWFLLNLAGILMMWRRVGRVWGERNLSIFSLIESKVSVNYKCVNCFSYFSVAFLGSDIKGDTFVPDSSVSMSLEDHALYFFEKYSKDLLVEVGIYNIKLQYNHYYEVLFVWVNINTRFCLFNCNIQGQTTYAAGIHH